MGGLGDVFKGAGGGIVSGALDFAGGLISNHNARSMAEREYQHQKEFAQNGIRWKVADAKAAGIHPIYAIGANTPTYSPQAAVGTDYGLSKVGQDIGRAIEAGQTIKERAEARNMQQALNDAQIENIQSQTEQHKAQTDAIRVGIINDALFNTPDFIKMSAFASNARLRSQQASTPIPESNPYNDSPIPTYGFQYDSKGRRTALIPSDAVAQRYEDKFGIEWLPFIGAAWQNFKGKFLGNEVGGGYWWHGDTKGYLPYPPKKDKVNHGQKTYYRNPYRE